MQDFPSLREWLQTDDVVQETLLRLVKALRSVKPESQKHLENLIALNIRRCLIDQARTHSRTLTPVSACDASLENRLAASTCTPETSAEPLDVSSVLQRMPETAQQVFSLIWQNQYSKSEVAETLGISLRSVQRYWRLARTEIAEHLDATACPLTDANST